MFDDLLVEVAHESAASSRTPSLADTSSTTDCSRDFPLGRSFGGSARINCANACTRRGPRYKRKAHGPRKLCRSYIRVNVFNLVSAAVAAT